MGQEFEGLYGLVEVCLHWSNSEARTWERVCQRRVWSGGGVSAFVKTQRTALGKEWVEGQRGRAASRHLLLQGQADGPPLPLSAFC